MSTHDRSGRTLALARQHIEAAQYMTSEQRFADAHAQWRDALALLETLPSLPPEAQRAWMRAGLCSQRVGEPERALDELARAVSLARAPGLAKELAVSLGHLGTLLAQRGAASEAAAAWHEAIDVAESLQEPAIVYTLAGNLGRLALGRGDFDAAEQAFRRALAAAEGDENDAERGAWENALGELLRARGLEHDADACFERAFDAAQRGGDIGLMALTLANRGNLARARGNLETAQSLLGASYNLAAVTGDGPAIARAHANLGNLAVTRGGLDEAQRHYVQALALDKRHGQAEAVLGGLVNLGSLRVLRGDLEGGLKHYREALDKLPARGATRTASDLEALTGQVLGRMGRLDEATAHFTRALAFARDSAYPGAEARLAMNLAAIDFARGDVSRALAGHLAALQALAAGPVSDLVTAHLVVADCALAAARFDLAASHLAASGRLLGIVDAHEPEDNDQHETTDDAYRSKREYLDFQSMKARLAVVTHRSPEALDALRAAADALMTAGRNAEAHAERLALLEVSADLPDAPSLAEEGLRFAEKSKLEPLALDFGSVLALLRRDPPEHVAALASRADGLGLGLLALRLRRREVSLRVAHGRLDDARTLAHQLIDMARDKGALAELRALEEALP
jgi:tetratricopeptide (TPR) repeat protein